ncbi:MAG: cobalt transporter CbiM [Desulfovibrio sp.]|nr:cobalt transporter CbiM [Desulfovibrio sp.]
MHISEGVLSAPVLLTGGALAAAGVAIGLKKIKDDQIALCGLLSAAFFVGSLIHVPAGPASAHLLLTGLLGVALGWAAFPAIFVALLLQALLFQYGGLTTLGVNTFCMGLAAVLSWLAFRLVYGLWPTMAGLKVAAFCGGFLGAAFGSILAALALIFTDEGFFAAAGILLAAHLPVMLIEGLITMFATWFVARVSPDALSLPHPVNQRSL